MLMLTFCNNEAKHPCDATLVCCSDCWLCVCVCIGGGKIVGAL